MAGVPAGDPPIFVGGAGRSGTHIVAYLIGAHSRYETLPREVRFHALRRSGLIGFLEGSVERDDLVRALKDFWWRRPGWAKPEVTDGLHRFVARYDFDAALAAFASMEDPIAASNALVSTMLDPIARRAGKRGWTEHSPNNVVMARWLLTVFPEAKFIHVVRDGRDRACSVIKMPWGTTSLEKAMTDWNLQLRRSEAVAGKLPPDRMLVVHLEELTLLDRQRQYERLLEYAGLSDESRMREFFQAEVSPERSHVGRWRHELDDEDGERLTRLYEETLSALHADGITCAPPSRDIPASYARGDTGQPSRFDPWADWPATPMG